MLDKTRRLNGVFGIGVLAMLLTGCWIASLRMFNFTYDPAAKIMEPFSAWDPKTGIQEVHRRGSRLFAPVQWLGQKINPDSF